MIELWVCAGVLNLAIISWVILSIWRMQNALYDSREFGRQQVELQREANTLLRDLTAQLLETNRRADSSQDWADGGEYVIGPTK